MNRNTTVFERDQTAINISRSKQDLSHAYKSTFNAGRLYPLWSYSDVLPGDTFKTSLTSVIRMSTPVAPVLDDCYADVYVFFTPHKLTMQRFTAPYADVSYSWKYFLGAQDYFLNMPIPDTGVLLPIIGYAADSSDGQAIALGSFYERLGLRPGLHLKEGLKGSLSVHGLDYLAYCSVWNDFFRDENTEQPVAWYFDGDLTSVSYPFLFGGPLELDEVSIYQLNSVDGISDTGDSEASILPVCRPHGYFGSALPFPQRAATGVTIPLLGSAIVEANGALALRFSSGSVVNIGELVADTGALPNATGSLGFVNGGESSISTSDKVEYQEGLKVNLSDVSSVTINQLRALIAKQHFDEALARGGNRLGEMTSSLFDVRPHDSGDEHSEYLGGVRIPITISEVAQTAQNAGGKGLGNLGAYSKTVDMSFLSEKSFDTWGTYQVFICFRTSESFTQGVSRRLTRRTRDDFYFPAFAKIGDQPILNKEIYAIDVADNLYENDEVFGYQSAWAEYMYEPDLVTGLLRPDQALGYFTFANNFSEIPDLAGYIAGGDGIKANVNRVLQVSAETAGYQFIGDFYFNVEAIRPLPADRRPGITRI